MGPSSTAANRRLRRVAAVSVTDATSTPLRGRAGGRWQLEEIEGVISRS